jgi:hypothetical protein
LTNKKQAEVFLSVFDNETYRYIAKCLFVDRFTSKEIAQKTGYSKRHIDRLRVEFRIFAIKKLVEKYTPSEPTDDLPDCPYWKYFKNCSLQND